MEQQVEEALLQRALGCRVTETRTETTEKGEKTVVTTKELPPDTSAQMFWLKNRCPEQWRDKPAEPETPTENNLAQVLLAAQQGERQDAV